jgi:hypothetical protein
LMLSRKQLKANNLASQEGIPADCGRNGTGI